MNTPVFQNPCPYFADRERVGVSQEKGEDEEDEQEVIQVYELVKQLSPITFSS